MVEQRKSRATGHHLALSSLAALAAGLAASAAHAQAAPSYNAPNPTVVSGNVTWVRGGPPTDVYTVNSPTAVIDFVPTDTAISNGVPINFQRAGSTAIYQNTSGNDFTILNRIVPTDTTRPITFNGTVTSQISDPVTGITTRGGSVWFYSPAGFVLSGTAVFDVGNLLMTSADPSISGSIASTLSNTALNSAFGNGQVTLQSGAQINASKAGSYIALVAPVINQGGTVTVNGSAAYVAAEQATLSFSGGLFSISVGVGSDGGTIAPNQPLQHSGSTQGPSNIVNADNHGIYMVAVPKNAAITAIISPNGQLGFDVAGSASVQNGQVILSAGRNIVNGVIDDGTRPSAQAANLAIGAGSGGDGHFTSNVNARATDMAEVRVTAGQTTRFDQGLTLVGGARSDIDLQPGGAFQAAGGDVRVQAISGTSTGGTAFARSGTGATFNVTNDLTVRADKVGISLNGPATPDATTGGSATIQSNGGSLSAGTATAAATVSGDGSQTLTGGVAQFTALNGGPLTIGGAVTVDARILRTGATSGAGGNSTAGTAFVRAFNSPMSINGDFNVLADITAGSGSTGGRSLGAVAEVDVDNGTLTVNGVFNVSAKAIGGAGSVGAGGNATGFMATVDISANGGSITAGNTTIDASATAGSTTGGGGGVATGGTASLTLNAPAGSGPTPQVHLGFLYASAAANGGAGTSGAGGDATGGSATVSIAQGTSFTASNNVTETAEAIGGASSGNAVGGNAIAGNASFTDYGTANVPAIILIGRATGGDKTAGTGNAGGATGGSAFITGDTGGQLTATGTVNLDASAAGGSVTGGTGQGGSATSLGVSINALGAAHLTLHDVSATSNATAGASRGVATASNGNAAGATVYLLQNGGGRLDVTTSVSASANGTGGAITAGTGTGTAGTGTGGDVRFVSNDGTITAGTDVTLSAKGQGGSSSGGARGGDGAGGNTNIGSDAVLTSVGRDSVLNSSGTGGDVLSGVGSGGTGTGGSVFVSAIGVGQITLGRNTTMTSNGIGGTALGAGQTGGAAVSGNVQLYAINGTVHATSATGLTSLTANSIGGMKIDATAGTAGSATGGLGAAVLTLGGTLNFDGNLNLVSSASTGGTGPAASDGVLTGGSASITTLNTGGGGAISVGGFTYLEANVFRSTVTLFGNSAATTGGSASITANVGTITLGNTVTVRSDAQAFDSGASTTPATVSGGQSSIQALGGDITMGNDVLVSAVGDGGSVSTVGRGQGLIGTGGSVSLSANSGFSLTTGNITLAADGVGGPNFNAGNGIAGSGTGGTVDVLSNGTITFNGDVLANVRGFGGNKLLGATGSAGLGTGGHARVRAADGALTINGALMVNASGTGAAFSPSTADGGAGVGGGARLDTLGNFSDLHVTGDVTLHADGVGTGGNGAGHRGGRGTGGSAADLVNGPFDDGAYLVVDSGHITLDGNALLSATGTGGNGATGEQGIGGLANILAINGSITLTGGTATATLDTTGTGGNALTNGSTFGGGTGGDGLGGTVVISSATDPNNGSSNISIPTITAIASAVGGSAANGVDGTIGTPGGFGGNAIAGAIQITAFSGNGNLFANTINATATGTGAAGGNGGATTDPIQGALGGTGGDAVGGQITIGLLSGPDSSDNSGTFTAGTIVSDTGGTGGMGGNGGAGGTQTGFGPPPGNVPFTFTVQGDGGNGGKGIGGTQSLIAEGGPVSIDSVTLNSIGTGGQGGAGNNSGVGGEGIGGFNAITVGARATQPNEFGSMTLFSLGSDTSGVPTGGFVNAWTAGGTALNVSHGSATIDFLNFQTDGIIDPPSSNLTAFTAGTDGTITIGNGFVNAVGDVVMTTSELGQFNADAFSLNTNGSFVFSDPADQDAIDNFRINSNLNLNLGGNFFVQARMDFVNGANILAADITTGDINSSDINLRATGTLTTGNLTADSTIQLTADNGSGTAGDLTTGNLISTSDSIYVNSHGGSTTLGAVTAGDSIQIDTDNRIQAGALTAGTAAGSFAGTVHVGSTNGPIVLGDVTGNDISIVADDDSDSAGDVTTGNLTAASGSVRAVSYGGNLSVGTVSAADGSILSATYDLQAGNLTGGTLGGSVDGLLQISSEFGDIGIGNATGGAIAISGPANVTTGSLLFRDLEIHSLGNLTTGNITALASVPSGLSVQPVVALTAVGDLTTGNITADRLIALSSSGGGLRTGALVTTSSVAGFAAQDITIGSATTGTGANDSLFLSNASILGTNPAFALFNPPRAASVVNLATLATINPVAVGGTITANGPIVTGNLLAAAAGAVRLGAINASTRLGIITGGSFAAGNIATPSTFEMIANGDVTTGTIDADDVLLIATSGNVSAGNIRSGRNAIALASGSIALGGATTGLTTSPGALYLANASQRSLISGSDRSALLAAAPVATGGAIQITGPVATGAVNLASGAGLTIQNSVTASGNIVLTATGTATIAGAISAPSITVTSSDIALTGSLTASSANTLRLIARGGSAGVRFGGDGSGGGYNLSATEAALLHSPNISFEADGDVLVGAATLNGSSAAGANLAGSNGKLSIISPGTIRVTGAFQLNNMASGNRLTLNATKRVEVVTDLGGSLTLLSGTTADALGGTLELIGNNIAVGNNSLLSQLAANAHFAGRDAVLAAAAAAKPAGYLQANRIELAGVDTILVQNSGTSSNYAGFTAGAGGMEVRTALGGATSVTTLADLYIFGRVQGTSAFLTGPDTRSGITFTKTANTAGFSTISAVNTCLIPTGDCPSAAPPPEVAMILPNIVTAGEGPIIINLDAAGMTTPALRLAPGLDQSALTIQTSLEEPVSSGGNPSFWIGGADAGEGNQEIVTGTGNDLLRDPTTGTGNEAARRPGAGTGTGNGNGADMAGTSTGNGNGDDTVVTGTGNPTNSANEPVTGTGNQTASEPTTGSRNQTPGQRRRGNRRQR